VILSHINFSQPRGKDLCVPGRNFGPRVVQNCQPTMVSHYLPMRFMGDFNRLIKSIFYLLNMHLSVPFIYLRLILFGSFLR
jgi:hypothetical protein